MNFNSSMYGDLGAIFIPNKGLFIRIPNSPFSDYINQPFFKTTL